MTINDYEITMIKAVAAADIGREDCIQDALLIHSLGDDTDEMRITDRDCVAFGYELPEDETDLNAILSDYSSLARIERIDADGIYRTAW